MIAQYDPDWSLYARVVEDNIGDFVEELRTIDLVDLTSFIRMECFPNIEDLVNSSTELYFRAERLVFSWSAAADLRWGACPTVTLGMEFRHPIVSLFFNLSLGVVQGVEVLGAVFEEPRGDAIGQLRLAFADARVSTPSLARMPHGPGKRSRWP